MTNRRFRGWAASIAVLALMVAACSSGSSQSTKKAGAKAHEGVSVNVLTFTGPQIAEPLQRRAPEFQRLTGAKIKVVTVPFSDLYDKILTDMATRTNSYDAFVFDPQWMGDFVPPGYLEDIGSRVQGDQALKWGDIAPFFRDFSASYQGHTYTIPVDGDFQMVYYRSDLLKKDGLQPPATWDDYLSIAQRYNGKDLNGDGKPDYGSCIAKKRSAQSYWMFWSIAGSYLQTQGTSQGSFFDIGTIKPLVNNQGFAAALDVYKKTTQYAPPGELNLDRAGQGRVGDPPGVAPGARPGDRPARRLQRHHLPARGRRSQPRALRRVRRLVGRDQRGGEEGRQGRRLRFPGLHERAGGVERRRHARQDRLQPVPGLAVRQHRPVGEGRDERGRREELPRRHPRQPPEPEHDP